MRLYYTLLILTLVFNDFSRSQGAEQFGKIFKKSDNQAPVADAGKDIKTAPGSTITISGDKSGRHLETLTEKREALESTWKHLEALGSA